ncbi:unnamed protein product [Effrenium voratum]|nr:unnamed protein product [Effrenium voratum]
MDANAFHAAMRCSLLPEVDTLTYQGVFNEHSYQTGGPEQEHVLAISAGASRIGEDVWVACFLKSCRDGQPRDGKPIDVIVVLDVSGSMNGGVAATGVHGPSRLALAKQALLALLLKLREEDGFGLATFTRTGSVVQPLLRRRNLQMDQLQQRIEELMAGGGTTIAAGMDAALEVLGDGRSGEREQRLLFLTDMEDNAIAPGQLDSMVATEAQHGLYVSFVGIGMRFNARLAEEVTKHQGANYFCITRQEELQKTIVDNFDWNFFPAAFDVELTHQSDSFQLASVYGTPFDLREELLESDWMPDAHRFYPADFKARVKTLLLCLRRHSLALPMPALQNVCGFLSCGVRSITRVDTVFPSGVQSDGAVDGGLILLRLKGASSGLVRLTLRYEANGQRVARCHDVRVTADAGELDGAIQKGVALQRYVQSCRRYLMLRTPVAPDDPLYPEYKASVTAALQRLKDLATEFSDRDVDAQCPGLVQQLQDFLEMADRHAEDVLKPLPDQPEPAPPNGKAFGYTNPTS